MGNNVIETRVNKGNTIYEIIWSDKVCFISSQLSIFDLDCIMWILYMKLDCVWNAYLRQIKERGLGNHIRTRETLNYDKREMILIYHLVIYYYRSRCK